MGRVPLPTGVLRSGWAARMVGLASSELPSPTLTGAVGVKVDSCWALNSSVGLGSPFLLTRRVQEGLGGDCCGEGHFCEKVGKDFIGICNH